MELGTGDRVYLGSRHYPNDSHLVLPLPEANCCAIWMEKNYDSFVVSFGDNVSLNQERVPSGIPVQLAVDDILQIEDCCLFRVTLWNESSIVVPSFRIKVCGMNKRCDHFEEKQKSELKMHLEEMQKISELQAKVKNNRKITVKSSVHTRLAGYAEGIERLLARETKECNELNEENIGYQMLKRMGWREGTGLGKTGTMTSSLQLQHKKDKKGLGMK